MNTIVYAAICIMRSSGVASFKKRKFLRIGTAVVLGRTLSPASAIAVFFALFFIVYAFVKRDFGYEIELAEEFSQLILAVILIGFLEVLRKENADAVELRNYFTFAWLIASCAQLIPMSILASEHLLEKDYGASGIIVYVAALLSLAGFIAFFFGIVRAKQGTKWKSSTLTAVFLFVSVVPLAIIHLFVFNPFSWVLNLKLIVNLAPLFPAGFAINAFIQAEKDPSKEYEDMDQ